MTAFVPYSGFYTVYGAPDRETMLGPAYLLWCLPLCLGLAALEGAMPKGARRALLLLPLIPLALNLPPMIERNRVSARAEAQATLDALPPDATVFGLWGDLMPAQYLQIVEGQRGDLDLRNLILFESRETVAAYVRALLLDPARRPIMFLGTRAPMGLYTTLFDLVPMRGKDGMAVGYAVRRR